MKSLSRVERSTDWQKEHAKTTFQPASYESTRTQAKAEFEAAELSSYAQKWKAYPLATRPHVVVYGSSFCVCCTELRAKLEIQGWRYRWVEMTKTLAVRLAKTQPWSGWKGTLPVIIINGMFLETGNTGFDPWPIPNPKRRTNLIIGLATVPPVKDTQNGNT